MVSIHRGMVDVPIHRMDHGSHGFLNRRAGTLARQTSPLRPRKKNGPTHGGLAQ